jgi:hypothetical protein
VRILAAWALPVHVPKPARFHRSAAARTRPGAKSCDWLIDHRHRDGICGGRVGDTSTA